MSEPKHGVGAVVAEALKGEVVGAPAGENSGGGAQPGLPLLDEVGGPDAAETPVGALLKRRGAGRPPGAQNRVTRDIRKLYLSLHKHPLLATGEIASMDVKVLAAYLDCKPLEAMQVQLRALAEIMPYLAAKQAAVDDSGNAVLPVFQLNFGGPAPAALEASDGRGVISLLDVAKLVEDQRLAASDAGASYGDASHEDAQVIDNEGERDG